MVHFAGRAGMPKEVAAAAAAELTEFSAEGGAAFTDITCRREALGSRIPELRGAADEARREAIVDDITHALEPNSRFLTTATAGNVLQYALQSERHAVRAESFVDSVGEFVRSLAPEVISSEGALLRGVSNFAFDQLLGGNQRPDHTVTAGDIQQLVGAFIESVTPAGSEERADLERKLAS